MKPAIAAALAALLTALPAAAEVETYTVDPRHTFAFYEIGHFGYSFQRGRFDRSGGKIRLDLAAHRGSADIAIDARSVNSGDAKLDKHLQSEDFFNAEKNPELTFKSDQLQFEGDKMVAATGDLTIAGVTRPTTFKVNHFFCGVNALSKKKVCGADLEARIKRSDFGMKYGLPGLADDVLLRVNTEAVRD